MYPDRSTITPEPLARGSSRGLRRLKYRSKNSSPKYSRNRSGSSPEPGAGRLETVLTLTTAGVTRSATALKASSIAWRTARASILGAGGLAAGWRLSAGAGGLAVPGAAADWAHAGTATARKRNSATAIFIGGLGPHFNRPPRDYASAFTSLGTGRISRTSCVAVVTGAAAARRTPATHRISPPASTSGSRLRSQRGTPASIRSDLRRRSPAPKATKRSPRRRPRTRRDRGQPAASKATQSAERGST